MKTKIIVKKLLDLKLSEYNQLLKLNLGKGGLMKTELLKQDPDIDVIFVKRSDDLIIGWLMLLPSDDGYRDVYIFVSKEYRRMGFATRLYRRAKNKHWNVVFYDHDRKSKNFINKMKNLYETHSD